MKISNGIKIAACSILMSSCSGGVKQKPFLKEIHPTGTTAKVIRETVKKSKSKIDNTYIMFGRDTLNIGDKFRMNVDEILTKINNFANVKSKVKFSGYQKNGDKFERVEHKIFNNAYGVINSNKVYQTKNGNIYLPIELYGKK